MIFTDYNSYTNNHEYDHNYTVNLDTNDLYDERERKLSIFCLNNDRENAKKLIGNVFDDELKYNLYFIPILPEVEAFFPFLNNLIDNSSYESKKLYYYTHFLHAVNKNRNALFIFDLKKWYNMSLKNRDLIINLNKIPSFWNVVDYSKNYTASLEASKIRFDTFMKDDQILVKKDDIDWNVGVFFNSQFISDLKKRITNEYDIFTITTSSLPLLEFDANKYKHLNFDLSNMNKIESTTHFLKHGWLTENRQYYYPDIRKLQKPNIGTNKLPKIVLLNHSDTLTGAPMVVFNMFLQLYQEKLVDVYLFTPKLNYSLLEKVGVTMDQLKYVIEFHHNPVFIEKCIKSIEPDCIIVNSFSSEFVYLTDCLNRFNTIQYVHESFEHYIPNQLDLNLKSKLILCADHKTKKKFKKEFPDKKVKLLPPKFLKEVFGDISKNLNSMYSLVNISTLYKWNIKPLIGMVGTPCDRKNFELFQDIAKSTPDFEFVWIGGDAGFSKGNLTVIPETKEILTYISFFNCFLLTSKIDLCPIVLLESLALNTQCVIFSENIGYNHSKSQHLKIIDKDINKIKPNNFKKILKETMSSKSDYSLPTGNEYVKMNFVYKTREIFKLVKKYSDF